MPECLSTCRAWPDKLWKTTKLTAIVAVSWSFGSLPSSVPRIPANESVTNQIEPVPTAAAVSAVSRSLVADAFGADAPLSEEASGCSCLGNTFSGVWNQTCSGGYMRAGHLFFVLNVMVNCPRGMKGKFQLALFLLVSNTNRTK